MCSLRLSFSNRDDGLRCAIFLRWLQLAALDYWGLFWPLEPRAPACWGQLRLRDGAEVRVGARGAECRMTRRRDLECRKATTVAAAVHCRCSSRLVAAAAEHP